MKRIVGLIVVLIVSWNACQQVQPKNVRLEFRFVETESAEGLTAVTAQISDEKLFLHDEVVLSNADIDSAFASAGQFGPQVELIFTVEGSAKFAKLTEDNINKRIGMLVDGKLISAPSIRAKIPDGRAIIWGKWTKEEAELIARGIIAK